MRGQAAYWLESLSAQDSGSYDRVIAAFREAFCPSPELRWKQAGDMFKKGQQAGESVDAFVTRLKKGARRINVSDEMLNFAVIQGLRSPIRIHVLQQGVKGLAETLRAARIAETIRPETEAAQGEAAILNLPD